jgi:hypothetical protein
MASLYTKNGVPLRVSGSAVYNPSGENFGYLSGDRVYGNDGRYRGTIVGDRLIHRSTDSARVASAQVPRVGSVGSAAASRAGSALLGDEPDIRP